ncbi:hypothetical protein BD414DRAFT_462616 [Trametes punicea]|nr:hypothetical protein BD414DRAFT_462616 [Trametes punicea]
MPAQLIQTGPGQSFSIPLTPSSPSVASPSSTSSTALGSPYPYPLPRSHNRRASEPQVLSASQSCSHKAEHQYAYVSAVIISQLRATSYGLRRSNGRCECQEILLRQASAAIPAIPFLQMPDTQPLRLHQEISTFPFFSFSGLTDVVGKLGLSDESYLDLYDSRAGAWEQQQVSAVRRVESGQRLMYRVRRDLFDGLRDEECPGLDNEIRMQEEEQSIRAGSLLARSVRKRPADESASPAVSKHSRSVSAQSYASPYSPESSFSVDGPASPFSMQQDSPIAITNPPLPATPASSYGPYPTSYSATSRNSEDSTRAEHHDTTSDLTSAQLSPESRFGASDGCQAIPVPASSAPLAHSNPITAALLSSSSTIPIPPPPPPSLSLLSGPAPRRWPNDFFVYEVAAGLREMDRLARAEPALKQDEVFRRAFGLPYVKSTFCRHRGLWRQASAAMCAEFEEMGRDARACWGEFVRRVEGRVESARGGRKGRARARGGAHGGGVPDEEGGEEGAQERMMGVIGMPLPMLLASMPVHQDSRSGAAESRAGPPERAVQEDVRLQSEGGEEPVMGSLRTLGEEQQMQLSEWDSFLMWPGSS